MSFISYEYYIIFKNTYFVEHLKIAASLNLQQLTQKLFDLISLK